MQADEVLPLISLHSVYDYAGGIRGGVWFIAFFVNLYYL